jgi:hypothetical protein
VSRRASCGETLATFEKNRSRVASGKCQTSSANVSAKLKNATWSFFALVSASPESCVVPT